MSIQDLTVGARDVQTNGGIVSLTLRCSINNKFILPPYFNIACIGCVLESRFNLNIQLKLNHYFDKMFENFELFCLMSVFVLSIFFMKDKKGGEREIFISSLK